MTDDFNDVWVATGADGQIAGVVALAPGDAPGALDLNKLFIEPRESLDLTGDFNTPGERASPIRRRSAGSPKLARTAEGLLALGSAAQMRLEITITRGIEPDLVERQQAAGHRIRGPLTDPPHPGALVESRCVRVATS